MTATRGPKDERAALVDDIRSRMQQQRWLPASLGIRAVDMIEADENRLAVAEEAFANAPHGGECAGWTETPGDMYDGEPHDDVMDEDECDCWKAEYDAAKEAL